MNIEEGLWQKIVELKHINWSDNNLGWSFDGDLFSEITPSKGLSSHTIAILLKSNYESSLKELMTDYQSIIISISGYKLYVKTGVKKDIVHVLQNYWPLSVLGQLNSELPHVFIHAATSLDGYLATSTGHSQWIGNDENLIHAHRLRALFDAVLVGGKTVLADKPSLNVRHVCGDDPIRLILSNKCKNLSALKKSTMCKTFLLRDLQYSYDDCTKHFDKIIFFNGSSKKEKMVDLLNKCKQEKIKTILIEGGGTTLSSFIETKLAKTIQFHLSPMLFGNGIKAVNLPKIQEVNESHQLKNMVVTPIGNSFMVTASLK